MTPRKSLSHSVVFPFFVIALPALLLVLVFGSLARDSHALREGNGKRWYRGNTHTHTLWSDGDAAPEISVAWYKNAGYDFLCLSDHDILSNIEKWFPVQPKSRLTSESVEQIREQFGDDWVVTRDSEAGAEMRLKTLDELRARFDEPNNFLLIQSEEISSRLPSVHVNGINVQELVIASNGKSVAETIQANIEAVEEQGRRLGIATLAHLNHPNWGNGVSAEDIIAAGGERFFEVYNGHGGVYNGGQPAKGFPSTDRLWDIILAMRLKDNRERPLYGLATDDTHDYFKTGLGECNPGRGWIMVLAESLSPDAIVNAMKRGEFYSSSGVELKEVASDNKTYRVEIAAEPGVTYQTEFIGTLKEFDSSSKPTLGADGNPLPNATRQYSGEIGKVLLTTTENPAVYRFKGDELYVRARVTASRLQPNPHATGDYERAWTQPVVN